MPETADTELQFPANFLKSFEISIQRRQNFSISCNNLVKLAMSFSTHQTKERSGTSSHVPDLIRSFVVDRNGRFAFLNGFLVILALFDDGDL